MPLFIHDRVLLANKSYCNLSQVVSHEGLPLIMEQDSWGDSGRERRVRQSRSDMQADASPKHLRGRDNVDLPLPGGAIVPEKLLRTALTHSSFAQEHRGLTDNERLEFLGDAVVSLAFSQYLYESFPNLREGALTLARARSVSTAALAERAKALQLGTHLRLGHGEDRSGGRERASILADTFEAVVGAIFLGCGWDTARQFVVDQLSGSAQVAEKDSKTQLQEILQAKSRKAPTYKVHLAEGPDHARVFTVEVSHGDRILGMGSGRSKKEAEQNAAREALHVLMQPDQL